jgi:D-inositol-3-phosphate glycosyltransferase
MIRVAHLIDDPNLGGVTRTVADTLRHLGQGIAGRIVPVRTAWRLPPRVEADVIVIDFTLSWAKLLFLLVLRLATEAPIVIVEHSYTGAYEQRCVRRRWRFRLMLRLAYRLADKVVAVSEGQAAWLAGAGLVAPHRLVAIAQSLDLSALTPIPDAARHTGPLRLGAYGRYAEQKGFDVLIAAMRAVPADTATLVLAGYGPDAAALRAAADGMAHVTVGGPIDGPVGFLASVDAVVVPSRWEAYGLVGQEARAAGRPVIACAVDGLVEQVTDACGLLVPPDDASALAAAICRMATMDRAAMAAAARASVQGAFERKLEAWRDLFVRLAPGAESESGRA